MVLVGSYPENDVKRQSRGGGLGEEDGYCQVPIGRYEGGEKSRDQCYKSLQVLLV